MSNTQKINWPLYSGILAAIASFVTIIAYVTSINVRCTIAQILNIESNDCKLTPDLINVDFIVQTLEREPIEGANVTFIFKDAPEIRITNGQGYVSNQIPFRKDVDVIISKQGYETLTQTLNLDPKRDNKPVIYQLKQKQQFPSQPPSQPPSSPPSQPPSKNSVFNLTATELLKNYLVNPIATQNSYQNKLITIKGYVNETSVHECAYPPNIPEKPVRAEQQQSTQCIKLFGDGDYQNYYVDCYFPSSRINELEDVSRKSITEKGVNITVQGVPLISSNVGYGIKLINSEIIK